MCVGLSLSFLLLKLVDYVPPRSACADISANKFFNLLFEQDNASDSRFYINVAVADNLMLGFFNIFDEGFHISPLNWEYWRPEYLCGF